MEVRNKRGIFRFGLFLLSVLAVFSLGLVRVFAESIPFTITNVEVTQKSATATGGVTSFDNNNVKNNIVFHQVGDSVTYRITIKNDSDAGRVIENIDSKYEGEIFDYSFDSNADDEIEPGSSFDFVLKVSYKKAVSDVDYRSQELTIKFVFKFTDGSEMSFTIANPSTWDNISVFGVILALSVIGLLIVVIFHMRRWSNDKKIIVTAILLIFACLPLPFVNAVAGEYDVVVANDVELRDQVIVDYYDENESQIASAVFNYNEKAVDVVLPEKVGYDFDGWYTSNGVKYNFETPLVDDLALHARYVPISYTIQFDANGGEGTTASQSAKYDEAVKLNKNGFSRAGYTFVGWSKQADGAVVYADEQVVENLCDVVCAVKLYAKWEANTDTRYTVIDKFMTVSGEGYDSETRSDTKGTTDTEVTPAPLEREGFVKPAPQTKIITGDGLMTIEYEYVRVKKTLTIQDAEYVESSHASGQYNYGTQVSLKAKQRDGWKFVKWSNDATDKEIVLVLDRDITIRPIYEESELELVFSHDGACTFNGITSSADGSNGLRDADNITGEECSDYADQKYIDTGVKLYSAENAHKDFYVEFTIDEFDLAKNGQRATIFNATQEKNSNRFPGIVVRRNDNSSQLMLGVNVVKDREKVLDYKNNIGAASAVRKIRIARKNDAICYAVNDGDFVYIGDNSPHNQYFETPSVMFGASFNENISESRVERYLNGTLSGIKILLGTDTADEINCSAP